MSRIVVKQCLFCEFLWLLHKLCVVNTAATCDSYVEWAQHWNSLPQLVGVCVVMLSGCCFSPVQIMIIAFKLSSLAKFIWIIIR